MKDEEMAKEYALGRTYPKFETSYIANFCLREIEGAFLAGLKAGRPQWHDLKKDPNDLPKLTTPVLVRLESGVPYVSWISSDKGWWFCTNYYTGEDKVIAWCELPTFDKE